MKTNSNVTKGYERLRRFAVTRCYATSRNLSHLLVTSRNLFFLFLITGCTVKAVGDPNRPITINANVVVDIRGLKQTAASIEDRVAQGGQ